MKKEPFTPFPIGTVRGPYICGKGTDPGGGVQYLVNGPDGWIPFIESRGRQEECKQAAHEYAAKLNNTPAN